MLYIVGLGPGSINAIDSEVKVILKNSDNVLVRTIHHPCVQWLDEQNIKYVSFDENYDNADNFEQLYNSIADIVLQTYKEGVSTVYAVPGHPLIGEDAVSLIINKAKILNIPIKIVSGKSFIEPLLEAIPAGMSEGVQIWDGYVIDSFRPDPRIPQIIYQLHGTNVASNIKIRLMEFYPEDHQVAVVNSAGNENQELKWIPLYELDRVKHTPLTSLYIPPIMEKREPGLYGMVEVVAKLRSPEGCPWDKEQTPQSLKKYIVEEAYETLDAIDKDDPDALCEELGDLLLQVLLQSQIAAEQGDFTIDDVANASVEKLVRRHPHVFGDVTVSGSDDVLRNWDSIKKAEKAEKNSDKNHSGLLSSIPTSTPALIRAQEISKRAARAGFEWPDIDGIFDKLQEEVVELKLAIKSDDKRAISDELGDLLFTVVNLSRRLNVNSEESLREMTGRFIRRFEHMENTAISDGKELSRLSIDEWDILWEKAKSAT